MYRRLAIFGANGPAIIIVYTLLLPRLIMGSMASTRPSFNLAPLPRLAIIRHLRIFMQISAQSMPYQFPHYAIAMFFFCMFLYGKGNITYPVTGNCFFNSFIQRFFGYPDQLHNLFTGITNRKGIGMITMITILITPQYQPKQYRLPSIRFYWENHAPPHHLQKYRN